MTTCLMCLFYNVPLEGHIKQAKLFKKYVSIYEDKISESIVMYNLIYNHKKGCEWKWIRRTKSILHWQIKLVVTKQHFILHWQIKLIVTKQHFILHWQIKLVVTKQHFILHWQIKSLVVVTKQHFILHWQIKSPVVVTKQHFILFTVPLLMNNLLWFLL